MTVLFGFKMHIIISGDFMQNFQEYEQSYRSRRQPDESRPKEKCGSFMGGIILTQFFACCVLLLVLFLACRSHGARYEFLSTWYSQLCGNDYTVSEMLDGAKKVMGFLTQPNTAPMPISDSRSEDETELDGAGGEDLIYPKDNTSFSPFYLSMPIFKPVVSDRTTSPFGYRVNPVTDEYGFHSGLDIAAPEGSDIFAAFDGVVEKADYSKARGNYIFLNSQGGIKTVYCHCSELLVAEGDAVSAGQVIARVGSTGQATGPHLHFEIRINGIYYNPLWVLEF